MSDPYDLPPEVIAAIQAGRKIDAINRLREATGLGLADAKTVIDRAHAQRPKVALRSSPTRNDTGMPRLVVLLSVVAVVVVVYYLFFAGS